MKKLLILFTLVNTTIFNLYSQNKTLKGRVISDFIENMPFVSIYINDTIKVGKTDLNGFFKIDIPVSEQTISFKTVGLDPATIEIKDKCDKIEVIMMLTGTYDFITLKRAERKRKKRYKKLPNIHKLAFKKGVFETEFACYNRKFESYFLEKK